MPESKPIRVQRKRSKGWRMPGGVVYVGRPSKWGNPFTPERYWRAGYSGSLEVAVQHCVDAYRAWLLGNDHWLHWPHQGRGDFPSRPDITVLRGKTLACWCRVGTPCHADVLLEIANAPSAGTTAEGEAHG